MYGIKISHRKADETSAMYHEKRSHLSNFETSEWIFQQHSTASWPQDYHPTNLSHLLIFIKIYNSLIFPLEVSNRRRNKKHLILLVFLGPVYNDPYQLVRLCSSANLSVCYSATRNNKNSAVRRHAFGHEVFQHQENDMLHFQLLLRIFLTAFKIKEEEIGHRQLCNI